MKSFFHRVKDTFQRLFSSLPAWEKTADATLKFVAPLLETVVTLTAGHEAEAEVARVISEVQADLALTGTLIATGDAQGAHAKLEVVKANLSGLLAAGHIKDPDTVAHVTAAVEMVIGEVEAIQSEIPAKTAPAAGGADQATGT